MVSGSFLPLVSGKKRHKIPARIVQLPNITSGVWIQYSVVRSIKGARMLAMRPVIEQIPNPAVLGGENDNKNHIVNLQD